MTACRPWQHRRSYEFADDSRDLRGAKVPVGHVMVRPVFTVSVTIDDKVILLAHPSDIGFVVVLQIGARQVYE